MGDDATTGSRRAQGRRIAAIAGLVLAAMFVVVYRQVLGITQRPSWPPPADAVTSAGAQAATEAFVARDGTRPHDAALPFAWSTAATIEPLVEGVELLPADLRGRGSGAIVRAHPHVRLARGRGRDGDGRAPSTQAVRGRRGKGDRGQLRLAAVRGGARDVHRPRCRRCPDRGQRRLSARPRRPLSGPPAHRLAPGRGRPRRPPQAVRDRRRRRLDRRRGDRGPFPERRLPRRDGSRHRRRRPAGAGRLPDQLSRSRRPARSRPLDLLPRTRRRGLDADRARAGDSRRPRRSIAGDPGADRRRAPSTRRDERLLHGRRHGPAESSPPRSAASRCASSSRRRRTTRRRRLR